MINRMVINRDNFWYKYNNKHKSTRLDYWYSSELEANIIPNLQTDYNWILVNEEKCLISHSIVLLYSDTSLNFFRWLLGYTDLILVCIGDRAFQKLQDWGMSEFKCIQINVELDSEHKIKYLPQILQEFKTKLHEALSTPEYKKYSKYGGYIVDHTSPDYIQRRDAIGKDRWNGAYYYSKEIVENIIPNIQTDRNWVTVDDKNLHIDHSIVFVHNRLHPEWYAQYAECKDVILVVSVPSLVDTMKNIGTTIYLPMSVDVDYVKQFKRKKDKGTAFVGRKAKLHDIPGSIVPDGIDYICGLPRDELLAEMARYRYIYAVDRVAIEGLVLGCKILPYEPTFPDPSIWHILDNKEAAKILQEKLDEIDNIRGWRK